MGWCSDRGAPARERMAALGASATDDNGEIFSTADVVVIAVKPNDVEAVLRSAWGKLKSGNTLVVSIAAGVTIAALEGWLPAGVRVVRVWRPRHSYYFWAISPVFLKLYAAPHGPCDIAYLVPIYAHRMLIGARNPMLCPPPIPPPPPSPSPTTHPPTPNAMLIGC